MESLLQTTNALFRRRDFSSSGTRRNKKRGRKFKEKTDLLCVVLDHPQYYKVPHKSKLKSLNSVGLGEKLISIKWKSSGDHLEDILRCEFPKLNGYSYNLMKSNEGRQLMSIPTPPTIQELKKTIKKGKLYVIPKRNIVSDMSEDPRWKQAFIFFWYCTCPKNEIERFTRTQWISHNTTR